MTSTWEILRWARWDNSAEEARRDGFRSDLGGHQRQDWSTGFVFGDGPSNENPRTEKLTRAGEESVSQVKATLVDWLGDEERYPCHFGHKIGDEFIFDGEKFQSQS